MDAVKAIVAAYYKKSADYTYFMGYSTGGRQALIATQRYPTDFDGIATPFPSVGYYEEVELRDPGVRGFFRLFMLSGVGHCGGVVGPDQVDWLAIAAECVGGKAPDRIIAQKLSETGRTAMSRPLYPCPVRAVYLGNGN